LSKLSTFECIFKVKRQFKFCNFGDFTFQPTQVSSTPPGAKKIYMAPGGDEKIQANNLLFDVMIIYCPSGKKTLKSLKILKKPCSSVKLNRPLKMIIIQHSIDMDDNFKN
jgi:hypothetical protein